MIEKIKKIFNSGRHKKPQIVEINAMNQKLIAPSQQQIIVALCLIVPAYIVNNLNEHDLISNYELEKIIDNASYFLCIKIDDTSSVEQHLKFSNEDIFDISEQREVYIKIFIADGQKMLGKKTTYSLKSNLPSHNQSRIKQLKCLKNLSGLEQFNRV